MTSQRGFTILAPVEDDAVERLAQLLNRKGDDVENPDGIRFTELPDLHYASFVIYALDGAGSFLLFEGNIDGGRDAFLRRLLDTSGAAVNDIYRHCVGYPENGAADSHAALGYLTAHDVGAGSFYIGWPGHSVEDVRREHELRHHIEQLLDGDLGAELRSAPPRVVHQRIVSAIAGDPAWDWALTPPSTPFLVRNSTRILTLLAAPVVVGLLVLLRNALGRTSSGRSRHRAVAALLGLAAAALGAGALLRAAERKDDERDERRDPDWQTAYAAWSEKLSPLRRREDVQVQNHMLSVTRIKPGLFRLAVLEVVLAITTLVAKLSANRGSLGGISTIHFARWVMTSDRRHLLFMSNYDGSWERYLNDFIDLVARGLTAIWTNTDNEVGFPRTRWLLHDGARQEARFKAYARSSMVPTNTWYSAYPDVTVVNIGNNRELRRGLSSSLDDTAARTWLRRL